MRNTSFGIRLAEFDPLPPWDQPQSTIQTGRHMSKDLRIRYGFAKTIDSKNADPTRRKELDVAGLNRLSINAPPTDGLACRQEVLPLDSDITQPVARATRYGKASVVIGDRQRLIISPNPPLERRKLFARQPVCG